LIADLIIRDVVPGGPFEIITLGKAHHAVLGMEFSIHALDYITNQRRFIVQLAKRPEYALAICVARQREVLAAPNAVGKSGIIDSILHGTATRHVLARCRFLLRYFHERSSVTVAEIHHSQN
jgi:hypothetical protein